MVRALCAEIGPDEAIGTFETEYELHLHEMRERHPIVHAWEARPGGEMTASGRRAGEFSIDDALYDSYRFNLSRQIVGEVRGREVLAMLEAMQSGTGSLSTTHARSCEDTVNKLVTCAMKAGAHVTYDYAVRALAQSLDVIVHVDARTTEQGKQRWTSQICVLGPGEKAMGCSVTSSSQALSHMGLDSLRVFALRRELMDALGCDVPLEELGPTRTIATICAAIVQGSEITSAAPASHTSGAFPVDLSERDLAHLRRLERSGPDLSIVPLWIPAGATQQRVDHLLGEFWSNHAWLASTIKNHRWTAGDGTPRIRQLQALGVDDWEAVRSEFSPHRALALIVRVPRLGITFLVLDHILYDQDVLHELETDFLDLSAGFGETSSQVADGSALVASSSSQSADRATVAPGGWRLEFSCPPEALYERLCEHLQRWGKAHDARTLPVVKHVRGDLPAATGGGDRHRVENWSFDVASAQLRRSSPSGAADESPVVHLSVVEADARIPWIRLLATEMVSISPPSPDGSCSADIEVLLQRDHAAISVVSCTHLAS
uniref:ATPase, T2SS/T4P/T4SS family n=1 Tax=Tessaracoccus timonensis TaxID=2161816 RepID=UPI001E600DDF|nr:ATPase, T2SS/T4P/T4SS family [Tessaracoccus timonensis]